MKAADKDKYIKELRSIINTMNIYALDKSPKDELVNQGFYRAKAILNNFDHGLGRRMGDLMFTLQNPLRSKKTIDAAGLRNWVIEKTEDMDVYEIENPQKETTDKIKRVLENEDMKVQSNIQGEDEHIFVFDKKDKAGKHVHLIRDGGTGEIRIDPKDKSPHELLSRVETILTTKVGQKIRSTVSTLEFLDEVVDNIDTPILDVIPPVGRSGGPEGHIQTFRIKNLSSNRTALDCSFYIRGFNYEWRTEFKDPVTLEPQGIKEIVYRISDEKTFHETVNELSLVMEFFDTSNNSFHTRRELRQDIVSSGSFYEINLSGFHKVAKSVNDNLQTLSGITRNGDSYEMLFGIDYESSFKKVSIGISGTFSACWGFSGEGELKQAITELAHRKIRRMIKDRDFKPSYTFITSDFPNDYQVGWEGYVKTRDSLV